jgi:hypothetical protein
MLVADDKEAAFGRGVSGAGSARVVASARTSARDVVVLDLLAGMLPPAWGTMRAPGEGRAAALCAAARPKEAAEGGNGR